MFLNGGQAQMDTFDMKPGAPEGIRGPYRPIATSVPGTQISNMLPRLSRLTDRYTILRSASHPLSGHNSSAAYVLSGHTPGSDSSIQPTPMDHPTYGSVVSRIQPAPAPLPSSVLTPRLLFDLGFPTPSAGGGWLGRQYDPFPVARNRMMSKAPSGTASCRVLARWLFPRTFRNRVWPRGGTCWDPSTVPSPPPATTRRPALCRPPRTRLST